ncbi:uncharacterized protein LOC131495551 [Neofelis nebulosa]|uniref:uncharacterized protein LOC131495551 n=1 Tax=Neofelis nebulosa TaxID=61452 RepID=UPI00272C5001|nr:uncharacterized protein LOC131495551 [Neofelis nebulosa]
MAAGAGLRQIFPDASVPCPPRPLGGAAPGTERGKRGRAGGLSSHSREAAAAEPGSAAAAHRAPPAGRSGAARWTERSPEREEAGRRGTANDRAEGRLAQPILELLQHLFPKQTRSGARTERRGLLAHAPRCPSGDHSPLAAPVWEGQPGTLGHTDGGCPGPGRNWVPTTFGKVLGAGKTGLALDLGEIAVDRRKRPPRLLDLFLLMSTHVFYQTTPLFEVQIAERPQVVPAIATSHRSLISLHQQDCSGSFPVITLEE